MVIIIQNGILVLLQMEKLRSDLKIINQQNIDGGQQMIMIRMVEHFKDGQLKLMVYL